MFLCSILRLVAGSDVSVPYDQHINASDTSLTKGPFVKLYAAQLLWLFFFFGLGGDRKGAYNSARAQLRGLGYEGCSFSILHALQV